MDDPPSEGNENVIDIFIVSADETVTFQLTGYLEQRDYRVTVFTDSAQLKEALRAGKPNLLICDSTTEEQEGFEVCRQIKADNDLWVIPVLILTAATNIRDLLNVLDSNADNFIAQPYDLPYFLLLIEGMLATPAERPTPDQLKMQFKISHDDRTYVVAANRRKLLEYLLSAFEIAVNKSSELSYVTSALHELSESVKELEQSVIEYNHAIEIVNATVNQKEQKILALTVACEGQEQVLLQKNDEIENLMKECDADKTLITTHDETIRAMKREQEEVQIAHRSKTDALTSRISALVEESDARKTSLDTMQRALSEETTRSASREKTLRALTLEYEQQKSAFATEKNRAVSAEQEIVAVMQAKTQSEQDLTTIITDLNETAKQQAADLIRLKGEMEAETNRRILTEKQVVSLQWEFEQSESSFHSEMDLINRQVGKLQEKLTASAAALENEESIIKLQKEHLAGMIAEKEKTEDRLQSAVQELSEAQAAVASGEQTRRSLVNNLEEVIAEKEKTEDRLKSAVQELSEAQAAVASGEQTRRSLADTLEEVIAEKEKTGDRLKSAVQELAEAQAAVASGEQTRKSLADTLEKTAAEKEKSEQNTKTLSTALEKLQSEIEAERGQRSSVEEILDRMTRERDNALGTLRHEYEGVQTDLDSHKVTLAQRESELDATTAIRVTLERDLDAEKTRNRLLEENLDLAAQYRVQSGQQSRSLADELEQVKAALETERRLRRISEEKTKAATQQQEDFEQHLRTANEEMEHAKKDRETTFRQFKEELETAGHQIKSLEAHVSTLESEKMHADNDVRALTTELEHARTALADERESPVDVYEQLAAAGNEQLRMQQFLSPPDGADTPKENVQPVISKEPPLPVPVEHVSQSLTMEITGISNADNISLENLPDAKKVKPAPVPATTKDPAEEKTVEESSPELSPEKTPAADDEKEQPVSDDEEQPKKDDEEQPKKDDEEELKKDDEEQLKKDDEEEPEEGSDEAAYEGQSDETPEDFEGQVPPGDISLDRSQWMDLIKWAHHSGDVSQDQRLKIVRMGRLIHKDRRMTKKHQDQIREVIAFAYALGYRLP